MPFLRPSVAIGSSFWAGYIILKATSDKVSAGFLDVVSGFLSSGAVFLMCCRRICPRPRVVLKGGREFGMFGVARNDAKRLRTER